MAFGAPKTRAGRPAIDLDRAGCGVLPEIHATRQEQREMLGPPPLGRDDLVVSQASGRPLIAHYVVERDFRSVRGAAAIDGRDHNRDLSAPHRATLNGTPATAR